MTESNEILWRIGTAELRMEKFGISVDFGRRYTRVMGAYVL
jgi:hypothetical protein